MFPCPDFVRQLIEYFRRFFATIDHNHDADYSTTDHDHDDAYYTESEVDTLLSGKADDPPVNDGRYYTEGEVDTLLSGKSDTGHTHFYMGKVRQVVVTELSLSFPFYTSGTSEQQIPNFGVNVNVTTGKLLVLLTLPMWKHSITQANIISSVDVGGIQRKKVSQCYLTATNEVIENLGGSVWFVGLSTGYKYVSVFVEPKLGDWCTADNDNRQPRLTIMEFE